MTPNGPAAPSASQQSDNALGLVPTLGGRIRRRRLALGLSQRQLASRLGVTRSTISYWEADKRFPDQARFARLIDVLQTSWETLTDGLLAQSLSENRPAMPRTHVRKLLIPPGAPPVGETIRQLRILRGLSADDLVRASGVDRGVVSEIETGHCLPVLATLEAMAAALGATSQTLLEGSVLSEGQISFLVRLPRLGQRIRALRQLRRLTQNQLAARAGVIGLQISTIELGRTRTSQQTLERLAEALGSSVAELTAGLPPNQLPARSRGREPSRARA